MALLIMISADYDYRDNFIIQLTALRLHRQKHGDWPCNIKFFLKGKEDIAS